MTTEELTPTKAQGRPKIRRGDGEELSKKQRKQLAKTESKERQRQALQLRTAGATFDKIAGELGYASASGAHKAVTTALKELPMEDAETLRAVQLAQIDRAILSIYPRVTKGELAAIDRLVKLQSRQAELMGLDAAKKTEHNATLDVAVVSIGGDTESYIEQLKAARGETPVAIEAGVEEAEVIE